MDVSQAGRRAWLLSYHKERGKMAGIDDERDSYNKLIEVLETALGKAAEVLGSEAKDSSPKNRITIRKPGEIYEYLGELLDETLKARSKLR